LERELKEGGGNASQAQGVAHGADPAVQGAHMQLLPATLVGRASFSGCLVEAARFCGLEDHQIAQAIHISPGYMSRFMRGVAQQWARRLVAFMRHTQSVAPLQWIADQMGCDITVRSMVHAELAAARARLAELERGAVAIV
jgi:hypothetical protein